MTDEMKALNDFANKASEKHLTYGQLQALEYSKRMREAKEEGKQVIIDKQIKKSDSIDLRL